MEELSTLENPSLLPRQIALQQGWFIAFCVLFLRWKMWSFPQQTRGPYKDAAFLKLKSVNTWTSKGKKRVAISRETLVLNRQDFLIEAELSR